MLNNNVKSKAVEKYPNASFPIVCPDSSITIVIVIASNNNEMIERITASIIRIIFVECFILPFEFAFDFR